jgi:hypothetical protein
LILRGIKTVEYRTQPTRIIGERFHIYVGQGSAIAIFRQTSSLFCIAGDRVPSV